MRVKHTCLWFFIIWHRKEINCDRIAIVSSSNGNACKLSYPASAENREFFQEAVTWAKPHFRWSLGKTERILLSSRGRFTDNKDDNNYEIFKAKKRKNDKNYGREKKEVLHWVLTSVLFYSRFRLEARGDQQRPNSSPMLAMDCPLQLEIQRFHETVTQHRNPANQCSVFSENFVIFFRRGTYQFQQWR